MTEQELKKILQQPYSFETWRNLLPKFFPNTQFFARPEQVFENEKGVVKGHQVGSIDLTDDRSLAIFDVEVDDSVIIARNRRALRDIAIRHIDQNITHGALVFYHHPEQTDYRFTFMAKWGALDMETGEFKQDETMPKRYTYLFGDSQAQTTPARQFLVLAERAREGTLSLEDVREAFSVEALNNEFYADYQRVSKSIIRYIHPNQVQNKLNAHQGALMLLNRMMFVYFIQKKLWLMDDPHFLFHFWKDYQTHASKPDTFHEEWLNKVFFKAFNGKAYSDPAIFKELPQKYHRAILAFPYLNGGLFTRHDEFDDFLLPDEYFRSIFDFLEKYNFTIIEDSQEEVSLEINPELLGKMYEGMINATDLDDVDAENGIVYTERPEINFMTRRSMVEVLDKKTGDNFTREFLYHFCFDTPDDKVVLLKRYDADANILEEAVKSLTVLDPACGSGSMLIGMIELQTELLKSLAEYRGHSLSSQEEFALKKQIISESIYGVDVKEWAVRIAELRFWLYMISEAEFTPDELTKEPLLPNLDFKLRKGNSLLQEMGNLDFSIKGLFANKQKNVGAARKLNEFIKKKKAFITNQDDHQSSFEDLKKEELHVFSEFIREHMDYNRRSIKEMTRGDGQSSLFGEEKRGHLYANEIEKLEQENEALDKVLKSIHKEQKLPFSFDIDFMEVFLTSDDPGFDLIIGNPPYVRQEDILPADDALELERLLKPENKAEKNRISKAYKEKLSNKVFETWPFLSTQAKTKVDGKNKTIDVYGKKVPGRSDLYVYFQLLTPSLLNSQGTFCFIISNSWLDVEYGGFVQQFLLKHTRLHAIYDCSLRSFGASVNTVIYLHSAVINQNLTDTQLKTLKPEDGTRPVRFVLNKAGYQQTAYAPLLVEQEHCRENTFRPHYRVILKSQRELWDEGYDEEELKYQSNKWGGKYLRAPEIYFTILEKGGDKLVPLKEIADVRRGVTTGANEFFILTRKEADDWGIEDEFLVPILKSPRECKTIEIVPEKLPHLLFYCHKSKEELQGTNALKYIEWGEESVTENGQELRAFHLRPSTRGRKKWWDVGQRKISQTVFPCGFGDTFRFYKNKKVLIDKRLYEVDFYDADYNHSMNTILTPLFLELGTRTGLGDGLMDVTVYEAQNLFVLKKQFEKSIEREIYDIFTELGFDRTRPIRKQEPRPLPDRKALDDIIFDELGLTEEERREVYYATAELVKQRLDKAGSR